METLSVSTARASSPPKAEPLALRQAPKILAISSGGGHWVQLLRLRPAFQGCHVTYATVHPGYAAQVEGTPFYTVADSHRLALFAAFRSALGILILLARVRPDVVVTTGAAPGYIALRLGKWFGARTVWVDSVANAEILSLSGQMARGKADLWLTQWPHLAQPEGPQYKGNVL